MFINPVVQDQLAMAKIDACLREMMDDAYGKEDYQFETDLGMQLQELQENGHIECYTRKCVSCGEPFVATGEQDYCSTCWEETE